MFATFEEFKGCEELAGLPRRAQEKRRIRREQAGHTFQKGGVRADKIAGAFGPAFSPPGVALHSQLKLGPASPQKIPRLQD